MTRSKLRSRRMPSGALYHGSRSKKKFELTGFAVNTKLSKEKKVKTTRVLGDHLKKALLSAKEVNVADKKGKTTKTEILNVIENPANPHLVRRNIITKGAVVETKLGKVRVTSRPGQESVVNGILV